MKIVLSGNQLEVVEFPSYAEKSKIDPDWELFKKDQPEKYDEYLERLKESKRSADDVLLTAEEIIEEMDMYDIDYSEAIEQRSERKRTTKAISSLERSAKNAERRLVRLINANLGKYRNEHFITLTYKAEQENREESLVHLKRFFEKMRRNRGYTDIEYIGVTEIQPERFERTGKAVIHFHIILFNSPFKPNKRGVDNTELSAIWGHGRTDVRKVTSKGIANYLSKYMSKDLLSAVGFNKNRYLTSRNLFKPIVLSVDLDRDLIDSIEDCKKYSQIMFNDFLGSMLYKRYVLDDSLLKLFLSKLEKYS